MIIVYSLYSKLIEYMYSYGLGGTVVLSQSHSYVPVIIVFIVPYNLARMYSFIPYRIRPNLTSDGL